MGQIFCVRLHHPWLDRGFAFHDEGSGCRLMAYAMRWPDEFHRLSLSSGHSSNEIANTLTSADRICVVQMGVPRRTFDATSPGADLVLNLLSRAAYGGACDG